MAKSNIIKGAVISYVAIFLNIAISFFYTPWMIRQIGVSDYGLYSLIMSFISYFIMDFGLNQAVQRFIAKYRAEKNEDKVAKMVAITTNCYLAINTVIFVVLLVLYFFISDIFTGLTDDEIERLKGLYIIAATFSILNFMFKPMGGAMMAYEYFVEERLLEMINKVGAVLLVCTALFMGADVYALVFINGTCSLIASLGRFMVFKHKSKLNIQWTYFNKSEAKSIFSFSMWTFGRGLAQRLRLSLVPSILGIFSNTTEISIFALGMSLEGMIYTLSSAINGLFMPKVARLSASGNREEVLSLMIRVGRIELYIIGFIFSAFLIFGQEFIYLWVGADFSKVYYVVLSLIFTNLITFTEEIAENLVYIENKIRYTTSIIFTCSTIGCLCSLFVASEYGAVGCALCSGLALFANAIWANLFYYRKMAIDIPKFMSKCHLRILPIILIIVIIFILIKPILQIHNWFILIASGFLYTMCFMALVYLFLLNVEEKNLLKQFIIHK